MIYAHRNGETTPPTITGYFWLKGEGSYSFSEGLPVYRIAGKVLVGHGKQETFVSGEDVNGKSVMFEMSEVKGQWYGPIVPPWEQQDAPTPASDDVLEAIRESLRDREYALSAYYDGEPRALADAAKCREAMAWLETLRQHAESGGEG